MIVGAILGGIVLGLFLDGMNTHFLTPIHYTSAYAGEHTHPVAPKEVLIKAHIEWTPERIEREIRETFPENPDLAVAIAKSESGANLKPTAYNPEWHDGCQGSYGVFQMACVHGSDPKNLYDPAYNIARARELYLTEGWTPWGGYTSGGYKRYMN